MMFATLCLDHGLVTYGYYGNFPRMGRVIEVTMTSDLNGGGGLGANC
jgi:hypothetical protein